MFKFTNTARTELADLLNTIAEDGLPEPRDPDVAMDAIESLAAACMPRRVRHVVHIVTIVDRCDFNKELEVRAFTDPMLARQYGVERCDAMLKLCADECEYGGRPELFDPYWQVREVEYA